MTETALNIIPFVDFSHQHKPIQTQLEQAIQSVIQRGDFVLGEALTQFENNFARACGVEYGIGVACGTDAIALGLQACGIRSGDEILVPANTFIATLIGVLRAGAIPILVDCDPKTALIDLESASKAISPKTKAILPVHLYGQMVSPKKLLDFAGTHNLFIFEDAAQAHLAETEGYRAGSIGKASAFSFYPSKNLGGFGDGGMVVTPDPDIAKTLRSLRNYGAPQKYLHTDTGTNSRLDTLQAAVLNVKLPYLSQWNQQRNIAAQNYEKLLQNKPIIPLENKTATGHVYHLFVVRIIPPLDRNLFQQKLAEFGIQTGIHYPLPCHLQPAYQNLGYQKGDFPNAETLSQEILSLPIYPGLSPSQIQQIINSIELILCN
ncbi:MAG TPA: DegT/DnrJ/EryC1/StrS family aminotransferase [Halomicronema sp.]